MDKSTYVVLGSGATLGGGFQVEIQGTRFKPPLDRNFFESPGVQSIFMPHVYPALAYYRQDPGLEATWAKIDLLLKLCLSGVVSEEQTYQQVRGQMEQKARGDNSYLQKMEQECCHSRVPSMAEWELLSLVREVYRAPKEPEPLSNSPLHTNSPLYKLVSALDEKKLLKGIITFNYDTSLEVLFPLRFYYPLLQTDKLDEKLPLMKLHGSLNWQTDSRAAERITIVNGAAPNNIARMEHGVGWYCQPEVVGPTFFKQEITIDFQRDYRAIYYKRLWRFAWDELKEAQNLIFVGFSFPPTDFHAGALFRTAHLNRTTGFRRVLLCHRGNQDLRNTAEQVFRGRPTVFTEFNGGLEDMAERLNEIMSLLLIR